MKQSQSPQADNPHPAEDEAFALTVLQVLPSLCTGGVERGTVDVAAAVAAAGGRALVASHGGPLVAELEAAGATHFALPVHRKSPWAVARNARRLADLIARERVDIVHARSRAPAWAAWLAVRRTGTPFVTTFHGTYNFRSGFKKRYNAVMTRGRPVIAISNFIAHHIVETYGLDPAHIRVVPRGVDVDLFDPAAVTAARADRLRKDWDVPPDAPVVMLPGRLTRWKGQTVLLDALARMQDTSWIALLVGDDQGRTGYRQELERQAASLGLADCVRIAGHCDDMPAAYTLADIVVSASTDPEAFGRVAVEAQAMARPVIATDHGGSTETVADGRTGWLVPPGDPDALADALVAALALPGKRRAAMGEAGRANARDNFAKAQMLARTLAVYREAVQAVSR